MPVEYAVGYRKPPVSGRFQKGQSGNPGGRPGAKKAKRRKFAEMLDAAMCESTERVAMTPCASIYAASAKGMALDCVRGKTATIRLVFSLLDELDHVATDGRQRRGFDRRLEEMEAADAAAAALRNKLGTEFATTPVSQGVIEEEPRPIWDEFAGEALGSGANAEPSVSAREVARPLAEGSEQGLKSESERQLLAVSRRAPSEKELRRREEQAVMDRQRRAYESLPGIIKGFCDKHGYDYPPGMRTPKDTPPPLSEGNEQGTTNPRPEEGPHKRALRERFLRLAEAEREEVAKAAKAEGSLMLRSAFAKASADMNEEQTRRSFSAGGQAQHEGIEKTPRPEPVEGPDPLPDFSIWMRGQQAAR